MSPPDDSPAGFHALLHDTLAAPRLSASKVSQLSRLALHNVAHDHRIVTTLYKLNAALPPASPSRISSLYVFDAVARAAKAAVSKGVGTELTNERGKGTQASLLRKLEGVVASWVDGMIDDGKRGVWVEGREKTRKIVDIWQKGATFPQPCLDELKVKLNNAVASAGPSNSADSAAVKKERKPLSLADGEPKGSGPYNRSTTPPYPPPAYILAKYARRSSKSSRKVAESKPEQPGQAQPGELPPEVAKLLGIEKQESAKDEKSHTPLSGIPANVAALLPSTFDPSSHSSSPHTVPSAAAAVASQESTAPPPLAINHEQLAALAKFASNSQTTSGGQHELHELPPFPPPHPVPSGVITPQPYIPPPKPKPISPPGARYHTSSSSRSDRGLGERGSPRHIDKERGERDYQHRQDDHWRAGRQRDNRSRSRSPDRRTNGHQRMNIPRRRPAASLPNPLPPPPPAARLGQGRGIGEGDGEEDMALDVSDGEERAKQAGAAQAAAYPPPIVAPPYVSVPPDVVAPPFPPPSSALQHQPPPISMPMSSGQPMKRRNDLVTLHTFPLQTFDPSSADSWAKLGEAWQNSTGRKPEQMELMHWLATGQVMDFKMMLMGTGHENGDSSSQSHVSPGDMNGLSSATANPAIGLLPPSQMRMDVGAGSIGQPPHLSIGGGDQWRNVQGQAQWGNDDSQRLWGAQGQGY